MLILPRYGVADYKFLPDFDRLQEVMTGSRVVNKAGFIFIMSTASKVRFQSSSAAPDPSDLCYLLNLSWCRSPKTWCRFFCVLTTLTHGAIYAVLSCLIVLDLKISSFFPLMEISDRYEKHFCLFLLLLHFVLALPYLVLASAGTRRIALILFTFGICTMELLTWLGLLTYAVITVRL